MKRRNNPKTNPRITTLAKKLSIVSKAQKAEIWKVVARTLEGPSQNWAEVNLNKLNTLTKGKDVVLVPGKLLGAGKIEHPIQVYVFNSSASARKLIHAAKGNVGTIEELVEKNPKGTGVRLIR